MVFIGGGLGSLCRFSLSRWIQQTDYPFFWGTVLANMLSCFILGLLVGWSMRQPMSDPWKLLLMTGFCGGFSTFSTFTLETYQLLQSGEMLTAFGNVLVSVLIGLFCLYLGVKIIL